ncbi:hypothetical protein [Pseudomonas sp. IT-P395]|jgi:hypothetical protein|uniref:hypothetical protein n=1 Tax=Pseudomonas sp. IT-P395 TaxID=3026459 RepID=UPI0039E0C6C6
MNEMQQLTSPLLDGGASVVMGGNLLTFLSGVAREDQRFIKDSMRWAEYRADQRHNRKHESAAWFEFYSGVLWSIGWGLEYEPVIVADKNFSGNVLDTWAKSVSTLISRSKIAAMKETFQLLECSSAGIDALSDSTRAWGDFRFSPAQYNAQKELEIVVSNVRFLQADWSSNYLFWTIQHSGSQLDIQSRRFAIKPRQVEEYRARLSAAVLEMRMTEIELTR